MNQPNPEINIPPLQKGEKVAIVATARKVSLDEMADAVRVLESWGLIVVFAPGLFEVDNQFAGSDTNRTHSFQAVLDDPNIKAIFCARGGYGTVRMVDALDFINFKLNPKWIVGYSDITVLHCHIHQNFALPTIHGVMPLNMQKEKAHEESIENLRKVLFEKPDPIVFPKHELNQKEVGVEEAQLIGGNLSVLYSILGSDSDIHTDGKILFLEDLDEYLYHIDRMMQGLKRAGKLKNLKALLIGNMSDMKDNTIPFGKTAYEIIADTVKEYHFPVVFGAPCGHEPRNLSLVFGSKYQLRFGEMVELRSVIGNW